MKLNPDVVRDLLPIYVAGEASAATRSLVEENLSIDPDLARLAELMAAAESTMVALALPEPPSSPGMPDERRELLALAETRRWLRARGWLMGLALASSLIPLMLTFESSGVHFPIFEAAPRLALTLLAFAVGLWIAFFLVGRRLRITGL